MAKYWQAGDRDRKITAKQMSLLHVARAKLGLAEADYRSVLSLYGGAESAKELSQEGFRNILAYFERLGFKNPIVKKVYQQATTPNSNADDLPYPAQLKKMQDLFAALGIDVADRQQGFCRRVIKVPWPQSKGEANKIIEGLKAMLARRSKSV